ncbi:MAG: protein translocase subunit SecD [Candidatus Pelagibacter sp. TMED106]|nr:MAG: protein translocase subunit SecD [Candidatus Pelagibacter sp. TMED106]
MLNFSKINIFFIYLIFLLISFFSILNFQSQESPLVEKKVNLGLDLQGGSYLLLEIDSDPLVKEKIQSKVIPLKKLLKDNKLNYSNFKIGNKKLTFLLDDPEKLKLLFFSKKDNLLNPYINNYNSFELDLNILENKKIEVLFSKYGLLTINNSALKQSIEIVRRRIDDVGTKEPTILQRGDKRILVELPGLKDPERIKSLLGKTAQLNFRLVSENEEFGVDKLISENGEELNVSKRIVMSGENLIDAQPNFNSQSNQPTVSFTLDRMGAQKFGRTTTDSVGKRLAIVLDGKIVSAPSINEPITSGSGMISGNFSFQEATDLALLLRSGALPTPLDIVEERTVGPDLGEDSIKSGITSLIIGFILVILFMIYKYKIFGLIANLALIANLIMLVGVLTILEATLTLPGIAGIILTVGMAVDANVLIFERIKEELKTEKSIIHAFDIGYSKAKITVLDANITTLIAAVILFAFGSGPVKGFAITLGIGIVTTLFSAYFLARHLTSIIVLNKKEGEISL